MNNIRTNLIRHVRVLASDIGSRSIQEPHSLGRAKDHILGVLRSLGLAVRQQHYSAFGEPATNLVAHFPDMDLSKPLLLLGAHYDTVAGTPGADDNASAVAVMLETARLLNENERYRKLQILFAAFSTEEPPSFGTEYMGSRVFVNSLKDEGIEVAGAVILEMVGYYTDEPGSQQIPLPVKWMGFPNTADFIAVVGNGQSRKLVNELSYFIKKSGCGLPVQKLAIPGTGYLLPEARLSDNASFWDARIPAVMVTDTSFFRNPHYHTHRDRPETLDYEKMSQLVEGLICFLEGS